MTKSQEEYLLQCYMTGLESYIRTMSTNEVSHGKVQHEQLSDSLDRLFDFVSTGESICALNAAKKLAAYAFHVAISVMDNGGKKNG